MLKLVALPITISLLAASIVPAALAAEADDTQVSFFCNAGDSPSAIPETTLSAVRGEDTATATVLIWSSDIFPERAVALDLCQESARRLRELNETYTIVTSTFTAERIGDAIQVCLQPEALGDTGCSASTVVFATASATDPAEVLYEIVPAEQRAPQLRGDFPTVHPAFPFDFLRLFPF